MYIVMGNGESRKAISYELLNEHVTYGCNGIAREWTPSALVCIDNKMMHEIVDSGYPKNNKCYFRKFTLMDAFHYEPLRMGAQRGEVIENSSTGYKFAYFGSEQQIEFYPEDETMGMVDNPMHFFTWVSEQDQIYDLDEFIGKKPQDSGQNATELMCTIEKPDVCYLIGFDLSVNDGLVNNVYKNTHGYAPDYALPVHPDGWIRDLDEIFDKYSETKFIHVLNTKVFDTIETISVEHFINILEN